MRRFSKSLDAWNTPDFKNVFKQEAGQFDMAALPLQQGLTRSSYVSGSHFDVVVLNYSEAPQRIRVKAGIFYQGIIAGCSCADDPTPVDEQTEYCVLQFDIDRQTGEASVTLLDE